MKRFWGAALLAYYAAIRGALEARYRLFDPDEALEMLVAGSLRQGKLPYLGALSHRGPFLAVLYGVPSALFGPNAYRAVHGFCILLFVGLGLWFQRSVARATSELIGLFALLNLVLLGTLRVPTEDNWALNSDFLMGGLATAAMCLLLARVDAPEKTGSRGSGRIYAGVGLLLSLAFLTKQNAAPFVVVPAAYVVLFDRDRAAAKLGWLAGGLAAPLAFTLAVYAALGQVHRAWYFFYEYNRDYVAAAYTKNPLSAIATDASWFGRSYAELFALAAAGALAFAKERRAVWFLAAFWTLVGLAAAVAPGKDWDNYLWASHAPIALLAGLGAGSLLELIERRLPTSARKRVGALCVVALPVLGCAAQMKRGLTVLEMAPEVGGIPPPRVPRRQLLALIAGITGEDEPIYVSGYAPELYVLSERRPASRHVVSNFVESVYPGRFEEPSQIVPRFFAELRDDLRRSRPRVVLDACALGFLCHPSSALTKALPGLLGDYHALPGGPAGVFVRND